MFRTQRNINLCSFIVICSDSCACISAILNKDNKICEIRDDLIRFPNKIKQMWIPDHSNIAGNEKSDKCAKQVTSFPAVLENIHDKEKL